MRAKKTPSSLLLHTPQPKSPIQILKRTETRAILVQQIILMRLRRPLSPIRRQIRAQFHLIKRRHQGPHLLDRRAPPLRRSEKVVKDPFRLHGDGEEGRVARKAVLVGRGHGGGEPGHAVEAKGPFGVVGLGGDIRGPGFEIAGAEAAEEGPEFVVVWVYRGRRRVVISVGRRRVDDDEAGVWTYGVGLRQIGAHGGCEEAEVAGLGRIIRVHEDVAVLVMVVTRCGVDTGESFGAFVSSKQDGFERFVCLTLPGLLGELFALGSISESAMQWGGMVIR